VLARLTGEERFIERPAARAALAHAALDIVHQGSPRVLGQALMELGALVCLPEPRCEACPLSRACKARGQGTERALPRKRAKARPREERWAFARAVRGDALLLEKRGPGLLEGFWAFPGVQLRAGQLAAEALQERLAQLGVEGTVGIPTAKGRWSFTHRTWRFAVHPVRVRESGALAPAARWVPRAGLAELPVAQPHLPYLAAPPRKL
jgi:A/G-specific adenine glycosylase